MTHTRGDKILLLKDLCARLPYGVKFLRESWNYEWDQEMSVIEVLEDIDKDGYINNTKVYTIEDIKPYLRPMSSMTIEEECEFCNLFECDSVNVMYGYINWTVGGSCDCYDFDIEFSKLAKVIDWLNEHHFDYRGLIEKGLALEAPDGMYNTKTE